MDYFFDFLFGVRGIKQQTVPLPVARLREGGFFYVRMLRLQFFEIFFAVAENEFYHAEVFKYYSEDHHYLHINEDYPLYMEETPEVDIETDYPEEIEEGEGEDEIYTGDIFEGIDH